MVAERHTMPSEESGPVPEYRDAEGKILGKFEDEKSLVEAYQELEKKLGGHKDPQPEPEPETPSEEEEAPAPKEKKGKAKGGELSIPDKPPVTEEVEDLFASAQDEYDDQGQLSEETYESLAKRGVSRARIDQYIAGQLALHERQTSEAMKIIGGEKAAAQMLEWARANLSAEEIAAYNRSVNSGDFAQARLAIHGLTARWRESGQSPASVGPEGKTTLPSGGGFRSNEEVRAAMRDPRYSRDPAYREEVMRRIAASRNL